MMKIYPFETFSIVNFFSKQTDLQTELMELS